VTLVGGDRWNFSFFRRILRTWKWRGDQQTGQRIRISIRERNACVGTGLRAFVCVHLLSGWVCVWGESICDQGSRHHLGFVGLFQNGSENFVQQVESWDEFLSWCILKKKWLDNTIQE
jgi:hypothetical protein